MNFSDNHSRKSCAGRPIAVHCLKSTISLLPPEISCLEGDGNYTYIHTHSGKKYLVAKTIKNLQSCLANNRNFLRVHKSYLINTNHIVNYMDHERMITMAGGKEVFISRRKSKEVSRVLSTVL